MAEPQQIDVAMIGGRGFVGGEIAGILDGHPDINLKTIGSRDPSSLGEAAMYGADVAQLTPEDMPTLAAGHDVVILAASNDANALYADNAPDDLAVLDLGADIINDIWALRWTDPAARGAAVDGVQVVSRHAGCGICLMHMHREPQTMQVAPMEGDVVPQVLYFLERLASILQHQGVQKHRIVLDPGIGFGKTVAQNFELLARQRQLLMGGYPLMVGWSRKSSLAAVTGTSLSSVATLDVRERLVPSVAAALLAVERGASIVRVHDVRETVQAIKVLAAVG